MKWKVITEGQLQEALDIQKLTKKKLGRILMERNHISEEVIIKALGKQFNLPVQNISDAAIDKKLLETFSYPMLKKYNVIPLKEEGEYLIVAVNDPLNLDAFQELRNVSGKKIKLVITTLEDITNLLIKYLGPINLANEMIEEMAEEKNNSFKQQDSSLDGPSLEELETAAQDKPVVKLVNSIIKEALEQGVSDIHFEPQKKFLRVRFRLDGILYEKVTIPQKLQPAVISRIKIISGMDIAERRKPQDGRISLDMDGGGVDVRVSTLPDVFGEKVVLRFLYKKGLLYSLESLGMTNDEQKVIKSLIFRPYGMILVTGPTGSGKTTTLYSILNILNNVSRNIVTVEDPVEYEIEGINQTAINVRAAYTFATAIRHILRQDPDIIMIGEIRDLETAEIAIQAALTGHLVLATLHTNSAVGAITRLLDMKIEPFLIGSAVIGVIAQRLVRKICPFCRQEYVVSDEIKEKIKVFIPEYDGSALAKAAGCEKCFNMGYKGRIGIFENFIVGDDIRELILKKANEPEIVKLAVSKGMNILKVAGIKKTLAKITSLEEVVRVTFI